MEGRSQKIEDRRRKTEDIRQKTEVGSRKTEEWNKENGKWKYIEHHVSDFGLRSPVFRLPTPDSQLLKKHKPNINNIQK